MGHDKDAAIFPALRRVGTSCIVKCAVPFIDGKHFHQSFAERFLSHFISEDIEYPDPPANFDLYVKRDLHQSEILEVIEFSDPRFESLTGYSNWPTYHRIA